MPRFSSNGVETYYKQAGDGPDLVMIHGLAANHAFWKLNVLLPLAREYRVTIYDLRGHGLSSMPQSGYASDVMADDLHGLIEHLSIDRAHLVGHSHGGLVALHYATQHPDRVCSLALADTRVRALHPVQRIEDWPDGEWAMKQLKRMGVSAPRDEPDIGLWLLEKISTPEWAELRQSWSKQPWYMPFAGWNRGTRSAKAWQTLLRTTTLREDVARIAGLTIDRIRAVEQPVLALYGSRSRCLPSCHALGAELNQCLVRLVDGAGHFFPATRPEVLVDELRAFLGGLSSSPLVRRAGG